MKILALTAKSATFELEESQTGFYASGEFNIKLNGVHIRKENRNVFSLFGLSAGLKYVIEACGESINFELPAAYAEVNVKSFGATGDGLRDDTGAFTAAMNCLPAGSVIVVPAGTYPIKPIFLKSGITLYLEKGAVLSASTKREDYPVMPSLADGMNFGTWQGEEADCFASIITAYGQENIGVIGEGVIDCNASLGDWYKDYRKKRIAWRPRGIFFNRCKNVLLQGITVKNTPSWNVHPYFCEKVRLYDLALSNPADMPTTDGIDPDCCDGVEIAGVDISVGDDCIAVKSGTLESAKKYKTACRNIDIRNCLMRDGHGGVVFGSELSGGIENVSVTKCVFDGTDRGFRIKTRRGRGCVGKCGNVTFSNVTMINVKVPFVINMYYNMGDESGHTEYVWSTEKLPVDERTPKLGSFTFRNIVCSGAEYCAGAFYGLPESPIESVTLEDVNITYNNDCEAGFPDMREKNTKVKNGGFEFNYVETVFIKNVNVCGQNGEKFIYSGVKNIKENI